MDDTFFPGETASPPSIGEQIAVIETRLHGIAGHKRQISKTMSSLDSEAARLEKELAALKAARAGSRAGVTISDHALVRWLERHYGMDLEPYRQEMTSPALVEAVAVGAAGLKTPHGVFKIKDGVVTTFVTAKGVA